MRLGRWVWVIAWVLVSASGSAKAADGAMASRVREEMRHAWQGYVRDAWGHDSLKPLSHGAHDWYEQTLLMTPVDALDTFLVAGLKEEAHQAEELITTRLRFDSDMSISVFETTIRIVGGLLSSYELTGDAKLLTLARELADRMLPAFNTPTGMPYRRVNLLTGKTSHPRSNPAEVGSLLLELGTLSRLTGDSRYYDKAKAALMALSDRAGPLGLVGSEIDVETGAWTGTDSHVGGAIDSYYEYLYKGWLLFGDPDLKRIWDRSIAAINRYVADDRGGELWYGHVDMNTGRRRDTVYGALDAFFAGLLALSGDLDHARQLQESNYLLWTANGIEPELYDYRSHQILDPVYRLRPENFESVFYLSELTGDDRYARMGREYFESLVSRCRTDTGFAELADVRTGEKTDSMESFFFAETLKYAYLIFAPRGTIDLNRVVLNTEAHPLRRFAPAQ